MSTSFKQLKSPGRGLGPVASAVGSALAFSVLSLRPPLLPRGWLRAPQPLAVSSYLGPLPGKLIQYKKMEESAYRSFYPKYQEFQYQITLD